MERLPAAIRRTRQWLLAQQDPQGFWCAELEGDTILESETILLWAFLGREQSDQARRAAAYIIEKQLPGGGWAMYPGGPMETSGSVKAYFALKLTGHDPSLEYMQRARRAILAHGGADAVNSFTRFYLALLGQIPYDQCPAVPPEAVLLPRWFPINLYAISSWSRGMVVPLSIVSALQPVRAIDPRYGIRELFLKSPENWPPLRCPGLGGSTALLSWDRFFRGVDGLFKWCQHNGVLPLRRRALAAARQWILDHMAHSDGVGAIYPPIVWCIVALRALGYSDDSPEVQYGCRQLDELMLEDPDWGTLRLQPCKSPVWDTAIALRALTAAGVAEDHPALKGATQWLLDKEVTRPGDWAMTAPTQPGGWYFEHHNEFYPDCDDTAMVLMALESVRCRDEAVGRGLNWLLAMQNDDGGWGAFDRNNHRQFLCYVPFADHNAMIDPSTADLTGRVLEALARFGYHVGSVPVDRGLAYLRRGQEADGSWYGRWGVNYIYGTWQALTGLRAVGVPADDPAVVAGVNWLLACQQPCGGWGESADSYADPQLRGQGPVTASQTAWALLGLIAAGAYEHPAVLRGLRWLLQSQCDDGTWEEREFTGTGFPRVFYLRYHYYRVYFPLLALARWAHVSGVEVAAGDCPNFRASENGTVPLGDTPQLHVC
jgi:squalene-hopene/tetraprenyl-beta-curcumene cyclase